MLTTKTMFKPSTILVTLLFLGTLFMTNPAVVAQQQQFPPQQSPQQQNVDVSDEELIAFAQVAKKVDSINQQATQQMVETVRDNDLNVEKYNQIVQQLQSTEDTDQLDEDEKVVERVIQTSNEIGNIQATTQEKTHTAIQNEGLSPNRFEMILQLVNQDPEMQQRFNELNQDNQ